MEEYGKYSTQYLPSFSTPLDWVASAQHFGLPTRLIDWSFDPFCALYFALFSKNLEKEDSYRLLAVNKESHMYSDDVPIFKRGADELYDSNNSFAGNYTIFVDALTDLNFKLSQSHGYNTRATKFANMIRCAKDEEKANGNHKLFFCSIYDSNPRVIAQKGLFQIPRNIFKNDKGEYHLKELTKNGCEKIYTIAEDQREYIVKKLKQINISTPRLFPDLQNICDYLKREIPLE